MATPIGLRGTSVVLLRTFGQHGRGVNDGGRLTASCRADANRAMSARNLFADAKAARDAAPKRSQVSRSRAVYLASLGRRWRKASNAALATSRRIRSTWAHRLLTAGAPRPSERVRQEPVRRRRPRASATDPAPHARWRSPQRPPVEAEVQRAIAAARKRRGRAASRGGRAAARWLGGQGRAATRDERRERRRARARAEPPRHAFRARPTARLIRAPPVERPHRPAELVRLAVRLPGRVPGA